jgi:hypothetical protein
MRIEENAVCVDPPQKSIILEEIVYGISLTSVLSLPGKSFSPPQHNSIESRIKAKAKMALNIL